MCNEKKFSLLEVVTQLIRDWQEERKWRRDQAHIAKELLCESVFTTEPRYERLRDLLRHLVIDAVKVASFPGQAALLLITKSLQDLRDLQTPPKMGHFILDCGDTYVAAGKSTMINVQCQMAFRPSMLVIPPSIAEHFSIIDIKVGKNSQFLSADSLPASAFALADGTPIPLSMDLLRPGMLLTLTVQNNTDQPQTFAARIVGRTESMDNG